METTKNASRSIAEKLKIKFKSKAKSLATAAGLAPLLMGIQSGEKAPDFTAFNQDGKTVTLSQFQGKPVLIYFYPKDDTPGCTKQACELRDNYAKFQKKGAVILGVSRQDQQSHQEFKTKYNLPFDLLVDEKGDIAKALGVSLMPVIGLHHRQSVLVGKDGKVLKFFDSVNPQTHATEVLEILDKL